MGPIEGNCPHGNYRPSCTRCVRRKERESCERRAVQAIRSHPERYRDVGQQLEAEADVCTAIRDGGQ